MYVLVHRKKDFSFRKKNAGQTAERAVRPVQARVQISYQRISLAARSRGKEEPSPR